MLPDSDLLACLREKYMTLPYACAACGHKLKVIQGGNANRPSIYQCEAHPGHRTVEVYGEPGDALVMELIRRYRNLTHE